MSQNNGIVPIVGANLNPEGAIYTRPANIFHVVFDYFLTS
ncbi:hypothetical protein NEIFLAOT_01289 [Neisseria flavescens NRL30031/H210]|uniref:Uncharacterized protein n=1 Tax=Neisseria flavescens NRL30031/H210 TaxID=546264 RepID=C0EMW2_NEIFL|nr:hypothetical protein NEIFLAOT_01289 [Neisseria flavescens NRL30031/H210]